MTIEEWAQFLAEREAEELNRGSYRLLDPPPKCCGTCRYAGSGGYTLKTMDCNYGYKHERLPIRPVKGWGVCEHWELADD